MKLFSYKLKHDTGFAPNPFGGFLTLATCKPNIRKTKNVGDYVAGFTSKYLNGDEVGEERLIYLMRIDEIISISEYWNNPNFEIKKPNLTSQKKTLIAGDNIYKPVNGGNRFIQINNKFHDASEMPRDLRGENVIISFHFYYFGASPLTLPQHVRPKVPKGQSSNGYLTHNPDLVESFITYVESNYSYGLFNHPTQWIENDITWKKDESYIKP